MEMYALLLLGVSLALSGDVASATKFTFAHVYSDSMVLQRAPHPASIWGWADMDGDVSVSILDATNKTISTAHTKTANGQWRVSLPAQPASTEPVAIVATLAGGNDIRLDDVLFGDVFVCSGQSNMAFSVSVPTNDEGAEAKIAAAYATDPGASPDGHYVSADEAIKASSNYPNLRFLIVGNKHNCADPIEDFYPSPGNTNKGLALAHAWQKPSPASIGGGKDVMGGNGAGEMSAVCYYWGLEMHTTQKIPIGLIHSSYGGSAVEDWISKETLGDGKSGPCPGPIVGSMGLPSQQWNGQLRPLLNTTIKGTIWYQGESNHGQNELYSCRYQQMMTEWRAQWHIGTGGATDPNMPMGLVQIGPMTNDEGDNPDSFLIRQGQTAGYGYAPNPRWPNAFMATAFDLANPPHTKCVAGCIHIFNKQAVAHRLALAGRSLIYGEKLVFSGPRIAKAEAAADGTITVTYDPIGTEGKGISLRSHYGFEVTDAGPPVPGEYVQLQNKADTCTGSLAEVTLAECIQAVALLGNGPLYSRNGGDYSANWPKGCFKSYDKPYPGTYFFNTGGTTQTPTQDGRRVCKNTTVSGPASGWVRVNATSATTNTVSLCCLKNATQLRYAWEDSPSIFTQTGPAVFNGEGLPATPSLVNITS